MSPKPHARDLPNKLMSLFDFVGFRFQCPMASKIQLKCSSTIRSASGVTFFPVRLSINGQFSESARYGASICSHIKTIGLLMMPVTSWAPHPTATPRIFLG